MYFKHTLLKDKCLQTKLWKTVPETRANIPQTNINTKTEIVLKRSNLTVESHWLWPLTSLGLDKNNGLNIFNFDKLKKYKVPFQRYSKYSRFPSSSILEKNWRQKVVLKKSWCSYFKRWITRLKSKPSSL